MGFIDDLFNSIRNKYLNSTGAERDLLTLIKDRDISQAQNLMQNRDEEVMKAIREYNPEMHPVMKKSDKIRKGQEPYRTEKLPRSRQEYINEVELFFLLGKPILWKKKDNSGSDAAYKAYTEFLDTTRFNTTMRQAKRRAGAETESAKLYRLYRDENFNPQVQVVVLSKSDGYTLRPLFDQYNNLIAFGYGYLLKEGGATVEHFDIQTPDTIYSCRRGKTGWEVDTVHNPSGKINVIYYQQRKACRGMNPRIEREEDIDSKIADTNNYFADPIAAATADVVSFLKGKADRPGKMIQMQGIDSKFEYVNPPTSSETQRDEKSDLAKSILFDTFTPDLSFEAMKGMGTLSGEAIRRAMILGYIKRDNNKEIYDIAVDREKNLILAIMKNVTHIHLKAELEKLQIEHEFAEPFTEDATARWAAIGRAVQDGIMSFEKGVELMGTTDDVNSEIERIKQAKAEAAMGNIVEPNF